MSATIVGFSRPERLEQTLLLATLPIPDALWPELDGIARAPSPYATGD